LIYLVSLKLEKFFFLFWDKWIAPPPIIQIIPTKELFTLINNTISINCLVRSTKDYNLIWKQELPSSILIELLDDRIKIYENGTLKLMEIINKKIVLFFLQLFFYYLGVFENLMIILFLYVLQVMKVVK